MIRLINWYRRHLRTRSSLLAEIDRLTSERERLLDALALLAHGSYRRRGFRSTSANVIYLPGRQRPLDRGKNAL